MDIKSMRKWSGFVVSSRLPVCLWDFFTFAAIRGLEDLKRRSSMQPRGVDSIATPCVSMHGPQFISRGLSGWKRLTLIDSVNCLPSKGLKIVCDCSSISRVEISWGGKSFSDVMRTARQDDIAAISSVKAFPSLILHDVVWPWKLRINPDDFHQALHAVLKSFGDNPKWRLKHMKHPHQSGLNCSPFH